MPTDPIPNAYVPPAYQPKSPPSSSLDKDGFLKMLTAQVKNQDPSSSQDPTQYFETLSQMSMVEQLTNLAAQSATELAATKVASANALLGRTVTYVGKDGLPATGVVEGVDMVDKKDPTITVAGVAGIDPSRLSGIRL